MQLAATGARLDDGHPIASRSLASLVLILSLAPAAHAVNLNDAQIAAIVVAVNKVDIDAGTQAESKAASRDVRAFARQMVSGHTSVNKQTRALAKKLHVAPEENAASKTLRQDGAMIQARIGQLSGKDFDKAYIDNEVAYHQSVIGTLDKTLIPSASHAALKAMLIKVRPAFAAHLEHAQHIQAELK